LISLGATTSLFEEIAKLETKSLENATFGDPDSAWAHVHVGGHISRCPAFHDHLPECLPGGFSKLVPDEFEGSMKQYRLRLALVFIGTRFVFWSWDGFQTVKCLCSSFGARFLREGSVKVHGLVAGDDAQPSAKCVLFPFLSKAIDVFGDGLEYLLDDIWNVVWLEIVLLTPVIDQWGVEIHQLVPGLAVFVFQAQKETVRRRSDAMAP